MKRMTAIVLTLVLFASFSYAQMGGGMMGEQKGEMGKGMTSEQKGSMMKQKGMMDHEGITKGIRM